MEEEKEIPDLDLTKNEEVKVSVEEKDNGERMQLIIFKLAGEEYALHIDQIKEVVITPSIAKVPQTSDYIKGVANIRGNIIAIIDLETKFGLKDKDVDKAKNAHYTLVAESDNFTVGVLVEEVPNTLSVSSNDIDSSSNVIQYSSLDQSCIQGIVKSDDRMIILIDMIKMMEVDELKEISEV